jgi:hypothetical protein
MYINEKLRSVKTTPGMGEGGQRRMMGGLIQLRYIVRTFVNANMYPQYNNI